MDSQNSEGWLKTPEVCALLNVKPRTLWNWKNEGLIPYYRIGRSIRFKKAEIEASLRERNHIV